MEWLRKNSNQHIVERKSDDVVFLTFDKLEKTNLVKHGFSTRLGGVSKGIFGTMNLSYNRGDDKAAVDENYRRIAKALDTSVENMVFSHQTHTTNVRVVTGADKGKGIVKELDYENIDALVTNEKGIMLVTFYADCVPVFLVDTENEAIGLCHSGWRGTVGKITQNAIKIMGEQYGTKPGNIVAAIGPSICVDCYEVSYDVILQFKNCFDNKHYSELFYEKQNGKYQLNLWKANERILLEAGVAPDNIQTTDICTCCNSDKLFSHRASEGRRGNLAAFLELK